MATISTVTDSKRGCGWRVAGGMYLMSDGIGMPCNLLPHELHVCPTCGQGFKPGRGFQWVIADDILPHHSEPGRTRRHKGCPLNDPGLIGERALLHWIGGSFYPTPASWMAEGKALGFSRRIGGWIKGLVLGETWVMAAHRDVLLVPNPEEPVVGPAIFHLWMPNRIEYVVRGDETEERLDYLEGRGLTLVRVERDQQEVAKERAAAYKKAADSLEDVV